MEGPLNPLIALLQAIVNNPAQRGQTVWGSLDAIRANNQRLEEERQRKKMTALVGRGFNPEEAKRLADFNRMMEQAAIGASLATAGPQQSWAVKPTGPAKFPMRGAGFDKVIPDVRGANQLKIEDAVNKGDVIGAKNLSRQAGQPMGFLEHMSQKTPFTQVRPGVYYPVPKLSPKSAGDIGNIHQLAQGVYRNIKPMIPGF